MALYIVIQKNWKYFERRKNVKITKRKHVFKGLASSYNVEILNSFNSKLQLKDTESKSNLIDLLSDLKGFEFLTTLVLVFKKIESEDNTKYDIFYSNSKADILSMKVTLMMYFNQSMLQLYQTYKNL